MILCHEVWGITPALGRVADRFALAGFVVDTPVFYPSLAEVGGWTPDYREASRLRAGLNRAALTDHIRTARRALTNAGARAVGIVGFSMGGAIALWAAGDPTLGLSAAVTFYGGGITESYWPDVPAGTESAANLAVPWLGIYAGRDALTPPAALKQIQTAIAATNRGQLVVVPNADHGFALDRDDPRFDEAQAEATLTAAVNFLHRHLHRTDVRS
jgi:carboxymethylenebutenolidase